MSKRSVKLLFEDILESVDKIIDYTDGMSFKEFSADSKTADAVVRNFQVIGEAANRIPKSDRKLYPEIEWDRIRGFRNRIVHHYFGIDLGIVWDIMQNQIGELKQSVTSILKEMNFNER